MATKLLPANVVTKAQNTALGPGVALINVTEFTPAGIKKAIQGNSSYGYNVGLLSSPPTFNLAQETSNLLENTLGGMPQLRGAVQLVSQQVTMEVEFQQLNRENLELALPGLQTAAWASAVSATLTTGTGNAAFDLTAVTPGTAGNSITRVVSAPAGGTTTVVVTGTAPSYIVTINPATGATAADVVRAVNTNVTARAIVQAGLSTGSLGTGAVIAATSVALAGGAAGSTIGEVYTHKGFWAASDYSRNFVAVFESAATDVAHLVRCDNVISMDDFSFTPEETQVLTGIGMTFTATVDETAYNAALGTYPPPFSWYKITDI